MNTSFLTRLSSAGLASLLACATAAIAQTPFAAPSASAAAAPASSLSVPEEAYSALPARGNTASSQGVSSSLDNTAAREQLTSEPLPEAPSAFRPNSIDGETAAAEAPTQTGPMIAPKLTKYIPSGWTAQPLTAHDKVLVGLRDLYSPLNFLAMVASAGYEQALNGEPNYGTDRGAFGQRLGAAAIRESTQGLFTDSLFAPLLHEDPRYYVRGPEHGFVARTLYAATRPLITRTDSGHSSVNGALLLGYASSAALSYAYYPSVNRNFHDTAYTFGGSLGGAAVGYFVSEFSDDLLKAIHLKK